MAEQKDIRVIKGTEHTEEFEQKDKYPGCNGLGGLRGIRWDELVTQKCPTCAVTGEKKLDRPTVCIDCPRYETDCQGSNQEDCEHRGLDRPDKEKDKLRERINEIEFKVPVPMDNGEIETRYVHLEDRGIDQIIALFPDKPASYRCGICGGEMSVCLTEKDIAEEAKREERERIKSAPFLRGTSGYWISEHNFNKVFEGKP